MPAAKFIADYGFYKLEREQLFCNHGRSKTVNETVITGTARIYRTIYEKNRLLVRMEKDETVINKSPQNSAAFKFMVKLNRVTYF